MSSIRACVAAAAWIALASCHEHAAKRPNVLLISIDMLRADHLHCYGCPRATSPAIDRFASEGALFENEISSTSWTLPAHATLLTALPDSVHGLTDQDKTLAPRIETLAERFHAAGYETAGFFSGPYLDPAFGFGQGFERYEDCTSSASRAHVERDDERAAALRASHDDVTNPTTFAHFESWFHARSERPFFAFVHLWDVHYDFLPPPPFDRAFDATYSGWVDGRDFVGDARIEPRMARRDLEHLIALYDGEIAWTDSFVARIRALLEEHGVLDDTVVAITSDHGTEFFEHGQKGHRKTLYDEVLHVPLVVRFPRSIAAGTRVAHQTRSVDVAPTLLELAGVAALDDVLGRSLVPLAHDPRTPFPTLALSELTTESRAMRSVRGGTWKLFENLEKGHPCVLDLAHDPREQRLICASDAPLLVAAQAERTELLREVERLAALHAGDSTRAVVPDHVSRQLRELGYTGGDEKR